MRPFWKNNTDEYSGKWFYFSWKKRGCSVSVYELMGRQIVHAPYIGR